MSNISNTLQSCYDKGLKAMFRIALAAAILAILSCALTVPASALTGSGTPVDPYFISTADDLNEFKDIVNGGDNDA